MSATISLENVRKEYSRIKEGIVTDQNKVTRYDSTEKFLKYLHKIE